MFSFMHFFWTNPRVYGEKLGKEKYNLYMEKIDNFYKKNKSREEINQNFYLNFKGISVSLVDEIGHSWWKKIVSDDDLFNSNALNLIDAHKSKGVEIVLVTGSMNPCVKPIKQYLNIEHSLVTNLSVNNDKYTGEIIGGVMIGDGKAIAVKEFARNNGISLNNSFSYGDDYSDIPMMKLTKNSIAVNPETRLRSYAKLNNWSIIDN